MTDTPRHFQHLDERQAAALKRDRGFRWVIVIIATFAMAMSGAGLIIVAQKSGNNDTRLDKVEPKATVAKERADVAAKKATKTDKRVARNVTQTKTITRILVKSGIAKTGPRGLQGPIGKIGETGPSGRPPSKSEIAEAVTAYCAEGACKPPGVTRDDVLAAVTSYCSTRTCRGPAGADGKDGANGEDGAPGVAGQDGAPPPQSFRLVYGDFIADCIQSDPASRTYACATPTP